MAFLTEAANRGSIPTGPYQIENSLKCEPDNGERLDTNTIFTNYDSTKKFTFSGWFKRTEIGVQSILEAQVNTGVSVNLIIQSDDQLQAYIEGSGDADQLKTTRKFRDTSAWYHIMWIVDTTLSTASDRLKLYINGVRETSFTTETQPTQNRDVPLQQRHYLFGYDGSNNGFRGYVSDFYFLDGIAADATDFGEFDEDSGIWKPIEYTGNFGTEGYFLNFSDAANLGDDQSSNNQGSFIEYGISAADQATDTPTNNFCTLNPIFESNGTNPELTISEGATRAVNAASAYKSATSTIGVSTGKWYWEVNVTDRNTITTIGVTMPYYWDAGNIPFSGTVYYGQTGQRHNNSVAGGGQDSFGNGYTDGDIISFALDMDATTPTLAVRKNNSLVTGNNATGNLMYGLSLTGSGGTFLPPKEDFYFAKLVGYGANTFDINFGGYTAATPSSAASDGNGYGTFEYAPPSGYYAICTKNLAEFGG